MKKLLARLRPRPVRARAFGGAAFAQAASDAGGRRACGRGAGRSGRRARPPTPHRRPLPPPPAPVANKGDVAWMLVCTAARHHDVDPRPGAVLRRPGAQQEHAVGADAGVRHLLDDRRAVVRLRLQPGVHRGQRLLRRLRPAVHEGPVRPRDRHLRDGARPSARASTSPSCCSSPSRRPSPASPAA